MNMSNWNGDFVRNPCGTVGHLFDADNNCIRCRQPVAKLVSAKLKARGKRKKLVVEYEGEQMTMHWDADGVFTIT